jgi:hypothetical protein
MENFFSKVWVKRCKYCGTITDYKTICFFPPFSGVEKNVYPRLADGPIPVCLDCALERFDYYGNHLVLKNNIMCGLIHHKNHPGRDFEKFILGFRDTMDNIFNGRLPIEM